LFKILFQLISYFINLGKFTVISVEKTIMKSKFT